MKKLFGITLGLLLLAHLSWAESEVLDLRGIQSEETLKFEMFPTDLRVRAEGFSAFVPAGWSLNYVDNAYFNLGEDHRLDYKSTITFTPTSDIVNDHTFIGVVNRRDPKGRTLEEIYEKRRGLAEWSHDYEIWHGMRWLIGRRISVDPEDNRERMSWAAWYVNERRDFELLVVSQTPLDTMAGNYPARIDEILPQIWAEPK